MNVPTTHTCLWRLPNHLLKSLREGTRCPTRPSRQDLKRNGGGYNYQINIAAIRSWISKAKSRGVCYDCIKTVAEDPKNLLFIGYRHYSYHGYFDEYWLENAYVSAYAPPADTFFEAVKAIEAELAQASADTEPRKVKSVGTLYAGERTQSELMSATSADHGTAKRAIRFLRSRGRLRVTDIGTNKSRFVITATKAVTETFNSFARFIDNLASSARNVAEIALFKYEPEPDTGPPKRPDSISTELWALLHPELVAA